MCIATIHYVISTLLPNSSLKPLIRDETVLRVQEIIDEPISRGMDSAINKCLDKLDALKAEKTNGENPKLPCWIESDCSEEEVETQ